MRKIIYSIFIITVLFISSLSLTACTAITAQNITNTASNQGMSGGGMNGGPGINGNFMDRMADADVMGKIVSVDGNTIKIELATETKNSKSSNSNEVKQDVIGNQKSKGNQSVNADSNTNANSKSNNNNNNDNKQPPQGGFSGGKLELSYTGETKIFTVNSDVKISERTSRPSQNGKDNSKSSIKLSDLKKDQVIMIWYKQNTKTVERISVV